MTQIEKHKIEIFDLLTESQTLKVRLQEIQKEIQIIEGKMGAIQGENNKIDKTEK